MKAFYIDEAALPEDTLQNEMELIGTVIANPDECINDLTLNSVNLRPEHFASRFHAHIWACVLELIDAQKEISSFALGELMKQHGHSDELSALDECEANEDHDILAHAEALKVDYQRRSLTNLGVLVQADADNVTKNPVDIRADIDRRLRDIDEGMESADGNITDHEAIDAYFAKVKERKARGFQMSGLATGYPSLDHYMDGLQEGSLNIVAARPGIGKSAFALNIVNHVLRSTKEGPVILFTLEMPAIDIAERMLAINGSIPVNALRYDKLNNSQWASVAEYMKRAGRLHIDDRTALTTAALSLKVSRIAKQYGKPLLIVVDYLQLMHSNGRFDNRALEVADISRSLKLIAKNYECPVIALSQMNRSIESKNRGEQRDPQNSDLRESGALEQDADSIIFLTRETKGDKTKAKASLTKCRKGQLGDVHLLFTGATQEFLEVEERGL